MAVQQDVKLARAPALRDAKGIDCCTGLQSAGTKHPFVNAVINHVVINLVCQTCRWHTV